MTEKEFDRRSREASSLLPARYLSDWEAPFRERVMARLQPGCSVLDVGAGRNPTIAGEARPDGCTYVGLDVSSAELAAAGPGAYDETVAADATLLQDSLADRFDLLISWQVLEHLRDLGAAMVCARSYLRPGGQMVAMFSASNSLFALINRLIPHRVGESIVTKVMSRDERNPVFRAYYDRCTPAEIRVILRDWSSVRVDPLYRGAGYVGFSRVATRAYLAYENAVARREIEGLATHLLLVAER